jgi:plastocyanin
MQHTGRLGTKAAVREDDAVKFIWRRAVAAAVFGFVVGGFAAACGGPDVARADFPVEPNPGEIGATVSIEGLRWTPDEVTIEAGQSVVWNMTANTGHDLEVDGLPPTPIVREGEFRRTFRLAGRYEFTCTIHPGMDGNITVNAR